TIPSLTLYLEFVNRMKELLPDSKVFVFGTVIMATLDHWIRECKTDFLIYGEPEVVLPQALKANDYRKIKGIICPGTYIPLTGNDLYDGDKVTPQYGEWVNTNSLQDLPRPAWHLLDMGRYAPHGNLSNLGVWIQASRGCPIGCTMC